VKFEARSTSGHQQRRPAAEWVALAEEVFKQAESSRPRKGKTGLKFDPTRCT
jgi:hypothetical protein